MQITKILTSDDILKKKALFVFDKDSNEEIIVKFNLWARYFFRQYFTSKDAEFHKEIDEYNLKIYKGEIKSYTNIVFRGGAKTSRTKLFVAYVIANDLNHSRKYFKILTADVVNARQITTDIYNMLISTKINNMYPEIFERTEKKREETMSSFTTATGIKVISDTVGTDQRGALQEESRPDFIWFEDFENRKTLRSAVTTQAIWENMEEARLSLSKDGSCVYTCNYISEAGNVHKLVVRENKNNIVKIVPIIKDGIIAWDRYSEEDIKEMREMDDDFEGERLCEPSASKDVYFDRSSLERMEIRQPIKISAGFKIFYEYNPSHRYGSGHDIAKGVGLDSSTSVFIDFDTIPARVVGTFKSNTIKPEVFGDEIYREQGIFPGIAGIENNYGTEAILRMKQLGGNMYTTIKDDKKIREQKVTEYGWNTNQLTKPKMMSALLKAIEDGLLELSDKDLINEAKGYTRNDLLENIKDPRLTTRHFDLLIALAIAWQMKDYVVYVEEEEEDYNLYNRLME